MVSLSIHLSFNPALLHQAEQLLWRSSHSIDQLMETRQRIVELRRAFAPDLIHKNTVGLSDFFLHTTASAHPAPLLVTLHGEWPAGLNGIVRRTLGGADWVAGCSAAILQKGRELEPGIASRSSVIYSGLASPSLPPDPLPTDPARVLCLGRLVAEKAFDLAVSAFASVADLYPRTRLIIAGDGPARYELERQIAELGVTDRVDLIGWVAPDKVYSLISRATLVLVPSRQESFGLVALEAALMARPVVATRVGGLPEVVIHKATGLLVETDDSAALAEAIAFLLGHQQTAMRMGLAARRRAQRVFGWERLVDAYDALYHRLARLAP